MRLAIHPASWMFAAVAVAGVFLGRPEAIVLGIGGFIVMVVANGFRLSSAIRNSNPLDLVSNENRSRLIPIVRAAQEIEQLTKQHANNPVVKVMGSEAKLECDQLISQSVRMLNSRRTLQDAINSSAGVQKTVNTMRDTLSSAQTGAEREMLEAGIAAHEAQLAQVEQAASTIQNIDANLSQAAALLSELRTRLTIASTAESDIDQGNMRDTLSQLHSLSSSIEESTQFMGDVN